MDKAILERAKVLICILNAWEEKWASSSDSQGLLDHLAALKWVNVNIHVNMWAYSYLHFSPHAQGLFHMVFMQSRTLFIPYWEWRTQEDAMGHGIINKNQSLIALKFQMS